MDTNNIKNGVSLPKEKFSLISEIVKLPAQIGIIIFSFVEDYKILYMNDFFLNELEYENYIDMGYNAGNKFISLIHPEDLYNFKEYVMHFVENNINREFKCRIRNKKYAYSCYEIRIIQSHEINFDKIISCSCVRIENIDNNVIVTNEKDFDNKKNIVQNRVELDNFSSGLLIFNASDENLSYVNDSFCQICGYSHNDIKSKYNNRYINLICESDREYYKSIFKELSEYTHQRKIEYHIRKRNGDLIKVIDFIRSIRDNLGKIWIYSTIVYDDNLQKSLLEFDFEFLPVGIVICEYHKKKNIFKLNFFNENFRKMFPFIEEDTEFIDTKTLKSHINTNDLEKLYEKIKNIKNKKIEHEFRIKDSISERKVLMKLSFSEENKNVVFMYGVFLDIIESKNNEQNNQKREDLLNVIVESSKKMIFKYDFLNDYFEPINSIAKKLLQDTDINYIDKDIIKYKYIDETSIEEATNFYKKIKNKEQDCSVNLKVQDIEGRDRWYNCTNKTIFNDINEPIY